MLVQQTRKSKSIRERVIEICTSLPEVTTEVAGDHIIFRVRKKTLAYYLFNHHGDGKIAFCCKANLNEQRRLVKSDPDTFYVPAYVGPKGWVSMRLDLGGVDWETLTELVTNAYREIAPKKLAGKI